nr:hypothetical protein [Tanacetum cinerariifolium]
MEPTLPVLPRLDRLDRLLELLEEKHAQSRRFGSIMANNDDDNNDNDYKEKTLNHLSCKTLSSALDDVHQKGTLIDRVAMLENRVLQLSLDMDEGSTSRSSSSTACATKEEKELPLDKCSTESNSNIKRRRISENKKERHVSLVPRVIPGPSSGVRVYLPSLFIFYYCSSPSVSLTMSEEDQNVDVAALPKFDMPLYEFEMTAKDVKSLAIRHVLRVFGNKGAFFYLPIGRYQAFSSTYFLTCAVRVEPVNYVRAVLSKSRGAGGQIFRETFSDLKGGKRRFFFLDKRAIPDLWLGDTTILTSMTPFQKMASMPRMSALTPQDQIEQHTTRPLSSDQTIPAKTDHQKRVEVVDPNIVSTRERKARAAAKKKEKKKRGVDAGEEREEVYYECMEPFKSLMCLWVRSRSIAVTWLEKVVTPLIIPII